MKLTEITIGGKAPGWRASGRIEVKVLKYNKIFDKKSADAKPYKNQIL